MVTVRAASFYLMLIVGAVIMELIERRYWRPPDGSSPTPALPVTLKQAFLIGLAQCASILPGMSRSMSTIMGGLMVGLQPAVATEFSFYLAMPTMAGAFVYELYKSWHQISASSPLLVAVGFVVSFIAAWIVVKTFLDYVSSHGFAVFGWWRIVVGSLGLIGLALVK